MPCFKGIAVSVHANGAPLDEYGVQKQSRFSRISTYIPVPPPTLTDGDRPEPAKFAISITLLTPGIAVPYSTPKATESNPFPKPQYVGGLPSSSGGRDGGRYKGSIQPYIPMTNSENETIAAYIYFDGRAKEEVATLLRPGEETWVNSRWVQVPESEGGGLAEREFLFREVGLERWLNGLDLTGHDAAEKLERRRQKFEKRRRRQREAAETTERGNSARKDDAAAEGMEVEDKGQASSSSKTADVSRSTLRYGNNGVEMVEDDASESSSDDDEPPEATGQIKVAMFRVIASGEIKKGEYSPQFDAHDDDDDLDGIGGGSGKGGIDAEVEHTTSFAKPKSLDPKTISTQTVTGIDGPDKPYATFTFFYRGERQLQKMGILPSKSSQTAANVGKRRSAQLDFSNLGPLKTTGTVGFSAFRDQETQSARRKSHKRSNGSIGGAMDEDSDDDDEDVHLPKIEDVDDKDIKPTVMEPDDAKSGELTDGINRIRLKRQHSVEPESASAAMSRESPSEGAPDASTPESSHGAGASGLAVPAPGAPVFGGLSKSLPDDSVVGSPLKKHRASIYEDDDRAPPPLHGKTQFSSPLADVLAEAQKKHEAAKAAAAAKEAENKAAAAAIQQPPAAAAIDEDEEL